MNIINTTYYINSNKINKNYTLCVLSDIHVSKYTSYKLYNKIIKNVKKIKPDFIIIPGDFIYTADDLGNGKVKNKLDFLLSNFSLISPVFICLGNHDLKDGKILKSNNTYKYFKSLEKKYNSFYMLDNSTFKIDNINLIGLTLNYNAYYPRYYKEWNSYFNESILKINNIKSNNYNIIITHSPEIISKYKSKNDKVNTILNNIDLCLCGHMHDGLIPKCLQKLKIFKNDTGFIASENNNINKSIVRKVYNCRGIHDLYNGKLVITGGISKWCHPNLLFALIDRRYAKDITIIKLKQCE